jgi:hypothetical protein
VVKEGVAEDWWSSSTFEMDRRSFSSTGISNDPQSSAGSQIGQPEFLNPGM